MRTTLDCLPCLLKQALYTARLSSDDAQVHQRIMRRAAELISGFDLAISPPENAVALYGLIAEISGCPDPFASLKKEGNQLALGLSGNIREEINRAADPLMTAIRFAIAGNIIDYGAHHQFEATETIVACQSRDFAINDYKELQKDLTRLAESNGSLLYLADNCGELVFDGLLLELLAGRGIEIFLAVKERPIINDALVEDAMACGLDQYCTILANGTGCPGTPFSDCSLEFQEIFSNAGLIISKGQGNFETLSESRAPIYFLLTVKCPVAGRHIAECANLSGPLPGNGEMALMKNRF